MQSPRPSEKLARCSPVAAAHGLQRFRCLDSVRRQCLGMNKPRAVA